MPASNNKECDLIVFGAIDRLVAEYLQARAGLGFESAA